MKTGTLCLLAARAAGNLAAAGCMGLEGERVATIRRNLAAEPSVTGKRYAGLRPA